MTSAGAIARRLHATEPESWRLDTVRPVCTEFSELAFDPVVVPVHDAARRHVDGEQCLGIAVPVGRGEAQAFRDAADSVVDALGAPSMIGSYGELGPFYSAVPRWGAPYLRWRMPRTARRPGHLLDLHPAPDGPELRLQPLDPFEDWFWRLGAVSELDAPPFGFSAMARTPTNQGMGRPGVAEATTWGDLAVRLRPLLESLPAVAHALDASFALTLWSTAPGRHGALHITAETVSMQAAEEPPYDAGGPPPQWTIPTSAAATEPILQAARQEMGARTPAQLVLAGESQRVLLRGWAEYTAVFYDLQLAVQ